MFGLHTGDELRDRVTSFLRKTYPNKVADNVAADIGLPVDTVKKWFARQNVPNGLAVVKLIGAYGPELAVEIMVDPPSWLSEAKRDHERAQLKAQQDEIARRLQEIA
ncbi:hypothetical protein [Labrys miyagiensis]